MGYLHQRFSVCFRQFDNYFGGFRMPVRHAHALRRQDIAGLVGHALRVDEALGSLDFLVLADEPHRHRPFRAFHLHADFPPAAHCNIHFRNGHRHAVRPVPCPEQVRIGPHRPDLLDRRRDAPLDANPFNLVRHPASP
jgi:hypothetical protein